MNIEHEGKQYEMICGSDVINDGMYLELRGDVNEVLLFTFWSDADGSFTFTASQPELPFTLVETFVQEAQRRLPPKL